MKSLWILRPRAVVGGLLSVLAWLALLLSAFADSPKTPQPNIAYLLGDVSCYKPNSA